MGASAGTDGAGPLRLIQVGTGKWGASWLRFVGADPARWRHAALVDVDPVSLRAAGEKARLPANRLFTDLEAAIATVEADGVLVVVPPAHHRAVADTALAAGLPVLTEKPLAGTPEDCEAMAAAAARTGLEVAVAQNYRFRPMFRTAREVLASGRLGAIGQVRIDYWMHHDLTGDFRVAMEHPLLIDMSVHHLDLLRFVTGLEAREVLASSWNPPWSQFAGDASAACLFTMTNGARVLYNGSWHARAQHDDWNCTWLVECERGYLRLARGRVWLYEGEPGEPGDVQEEVEVPLAPLADLNQAGVLAEFARAVRTGRPTSTTAADNVRSIGLVFAALRSVREGRAVAVPTSGAAAPR